jgi:PPM family protein phosphatase
MMSSTIWRVKSTLGISRVNPPIPHTRVRTPQINVEAPVVQPKTQTQRKKAAPRARDETKSTFSQIHLVHMKTQRRTVVHIGTTVGRAESEIILDEGSRKPVHLRFAQVNPKEYETPIVLKPVKGDGAVKVDGRDLTTDAPIRYGSVITVGNDAYGCELYAWGKQPKSPFIRAWWLTNAGPVRPLNEDAVGVYRNTRASFFAVADGVGGAAAGEEVSRFVIQSLLTTFHKSVSKENDWQAMFKRSLKTINDEVRRFGSASVVEAGSTLTAVVIQGWDAYGVHIGDSRLYHWSSKTLYQVTTDHSTFAASKELGGRRTSQKRSVLTKAIGKDDTLEPDFFTLRLQPDDRLLLCSDGVYDNLQYDELDQWIAEDKVTRLPAHLIEVANERFNDDNLSAVCVEVLGHPIEDDPRKIPEQERVYNGYNWRWRLSLKATEEESTHYPTTRDWARQILIGVFIVALILFLLWFFLLRGLS